MSVTLLHVTNIGLKITDALTIPIIKCVISTDSTTENLTAEEFNALKEEIYSRASGMVSVSGFWTATPVSPFYENTGTYSYGDLSPTGGYGLIGNNSGGPSTYAQVYTISFNGSQISYPYTYTGYSAWETAHGFILVDEHNLLYSCGTCNLYVLYDVNPGITSVDSKIPVAPVVGGYSLYNVDAGAVITATGHDITGDIASEIDPEETDPYKPGGDTGDDDTEGTGGDGDFDGSTEPIDFPDLPTVSAVDTKFVTIFNPTKAQLTSLAEYMWSPLFDLDTLKKLWADPMDCILGLTMVPFSVPNGGTGTVAIGNVSTGISMTKAGSQYVAIDCGSINVKEFWGGYLDYDPYTKFQIYLPYVGIKPLLADEIMGKSIHVKYHCDILTGACNCFVKCGGSVLYSFNGQCSTQIPISGNDWRNTISAAVNIAGQAAGMYMTGGATAPMAITSIAQSAVNGLKPTVEKSGSLSGTGGMLAIQKPYLIATRPKQAVPKNQNKFTGYPAFITRTISSCSGYTEVYSCHLENIPCTADELNEIENLLRAGVIL